jgi:hypothetical protein
VPSAPRELLMHKADAARARAQKKGAPPLFGGDAPFFSGNVRQDQPIWISWPCGSAGTSFGICTERMPSAYEAVHFDSSMPSM